MNFPSPTPSPTSPTFSPSSRSSPSPRPTASPDPGRPTNERLDVLVTEGNVWPWLRDDARLRKAGIELRHCPVDDEEQLLRLVPHADVYVGTYFTHAAGAAASDRLRTLLVTAAGVDQIDRTAVPAGVTVANSYGHGRAIAEYVLMATLAAERQLLWHDAELRQGRWHTRLVDADAPRMRNVDQRTLGVVTLGHIGQEVAKLALAVGMTVKGVTRSPEKEFAGREDLAWIGPMGELDRLCAESDVVVVTTPGNPQTQGLIGQRQLAHLGPHGTLINVGRGAVVDEQALYAALAGKRLGYAALDVWNAWASAEEHPVSELPFAELGNVLMTPHYCATTEDTYRLRAEELAANLLRVSEGAALTNVVWPA
jgi:phosphoglycerate dehydrogenase-like enzyme